MSSVYSYFMDELEKIAERQEEKGESLASKAGKAALAGSALYTSYRVGKGLTKSKAARLGTTAGLGTLGVLGISGKLSEKKKELGL